MISEKERSSVKRMAGNIAAGLVGNPSLDLNYDDVVKRAVNLAIRINDLVNQQCAAIPAETKP